MGNAGWGPGDQPSPGSGRLSSLSVQRDYYEGSARYRKGGLQLYAHVLSTFMCMILCTVCSLTFHSPRFLSTE